MTITINFDLDARENALRRWKRDKYNDPILGRRKTIELGYAIRDHHGKFDAKFVWTMLHINMIWVSDAIHGNDVSSKLMLQAERETKKQDCEFARLHTFSFQASPSMNL